MDIRTSDLCLIDEALGTQIRLLSSRIIKTQEDELRIIKFQELQKNIEELILKD